MVKIIDREFDVELHGTLESLIGPYKLLIEPRGQTRFVKTIETERGVEIVEWLRGKPNGTE